MAEFVRIVTGEPFKGKLPTEVVLPEAVDPENEESGTKLVTSREGDEDWEVQLYRYMFIHGFCYPEDNAREMGEITDAIPE